MLRKTPVDAKNAMEAIIEEIGQGEENLEQQVIALKDSQSLFAELTLQCREALWEKSSQLVGGTSLSGGPQANLEYKRRYCLLFCQ